MSDKPCRFCQNDEMDTVYYDCFLEDKTVRETLWCKDCGAICEMKSDATTEHVKWAKPTYAAKPRKQGPGTPK